MSASLTATRASADGVPPTAGEPRRLLSLSPRAALAVVLTCFALLATAVLSLTPPWEANDEPFHVWNVQTLVGGHFYNIGHDGNLESPQFPLYYLVLAAYQKLLRIPPQPYDATYAPSLPGQPHGNYLHSVTHEGHDQLFVDLLRLPSILFALLTIALTFVAARRVSRDRWTPVVAAAIVAGVPKFVFVSGVVNNDNLSNLLGAGGLALAVAFLTRPPTSTRGRVLIAAAIGLTAGALILTKVTGALVGPGLLLAVVLAARHRREALRLVTVFVAGTVAVCGWWLVRNQIRYGDPLAAHAVYVHQRAVQPGVFNISGPLKNIFIDIPKQLWSSFWYSSGWNQFYWRWFWYLPFWGLAAFGIGALAAPGPVRPAGRRVLWVCAVIAVGALASVWALGVQANTEQGRLAFMGLPAIALLIALGYERAGLPIWSRFVLPAIGIIGTVIAIRHDVILAYL